jgi:acyl-[acyl carrier protein]--UDP-N-acetylglucosamine O-acyltransferase
MPFIHPTAEVETGATIGEDTKIWHLCHIRRLAQIGSEWV